MKRAPPVALALLVASIGARDARACPGGAAPPGSRAAEETTPSPAARAFRIASPVDDDDGPVVAGASSALAAEATRLFEAGRWDAAAEAARRVAAGEGGDDEGNRGIAQHHQAIALLRLGYPEAGLALLAPIAERPTHPRYEAALRELGRLGGDLAEPDRLAELIAHYPDPAIAHLDTSADRPLHDRLRYLQGFSRYRRRGYEEAISSFERVRSTSPLYPKAQFMLGMSAALLHKVVPAAKGFFHVLEATEDGPAHLRDLATISLARVYYSSNHYIDEPCAPTIDATRLSSGVKYWNRISIESELWPDALFEVSWGYFMAGDYPHALGNLATFSSGYLPAILYPEVEVLQGLIYYTLCQYDDAMTVVARMLQRYVPIRRDLATLVARLAGEAQDEAVVRFVEELRDGRASVPERIRPIAEVVLRDRTIQRAFAHVRAIDAEDRGVERLAVTLRRGALGAQLREALTLARRTVVGDLAARVRTLYRDRLDALDAHLLDAQKLRLDLVAGQIEEKSRRGSVIREEAEALRYGQITPDVEHVIWPFEGEYWRDELGSYRQVVRSRCGRY